MYIHILNSVLPCSFNLFWSHLYEIIIYFLIWNDLNISSILSHSRRQHIQVKVNASVFRHSVTVLQTYTLTGRHNSDCPYKQSTKVIHYFGCYFSRGTIFVFREFFLGGGGSTVYWVGNRKILSIASRNSTGRQNANSNIIFRRMLSFCPNYIPSSNP